MPKSAQFSVREAQHVNVSPSSDVKPENLLLYHSPEGLLHLKLADFGLAAEAGEELLYTVCGTPTTARVPW